jgi:hypothetical protein
MLMNPSAEVSSSHQMSVQALTSMSAVIPGVSRDILGIMSDNDMGNSMTWRVMGCPARLDRRSKWKLVS